MVSSSFVSSLLLATLLMLNLQGKMSEACDCDLEPECGECTQVQEECIDCEVIQDAFNQAGRGGSGGNYHYEVDVNNQIPVPRKPTGDSNYIWRCPLGNDCPDLFFGYAYNTLLEVCRDLLWKLCEMNIEDIQNYHRCDPPFFSLLSNFVVQCEAITILSCDPAPTDCKFSC